MSMPHCTEIDVFLVKLSIPTAGLIGFYDWFTVIFQNIFYLKYIKIIFIYFFKIIFYFSVSK
jgi:hypothetical protein